MKLLTTFVAALLLASSALAEEPATHTGQMGATSTETAKPEAKPAAKHASKKKVAKKHVAKSGAKTTEKAPEQPKQ